jgi:adenine/guanine phosphoribosyltransferase-like PRPP-binding protein
MKLYNDAWALHLDGIVGIGRGGLMIAAYLAHKLDVPFTAFLSAMYKRKAKNTSKSMISKILNDSRAAVYYSLRTGSFTDRP